MITENIYDARENEISAETENAAAEARSIENIEAEIWAYKRQGVVAAIEIGRCLKEAKEQLEHGEWLPWLEEKIQFSVGTAQRLMRLADEYSNTSPVTHLGVSKALILLQVPESEREEFVSEKHVVEGEVKSVDEMTKKELEKAIKERDAEKKNSESLRKLITAAEEEAKQRQEEIELLNMELEEMKARPVDVAVEKVADEEALKEAAEAAKTEAEARYIKKLEAAEKAKSKAEEEKKKAEEKLAKAEAEAAEAADIAKKEKESMAAQAEQLRKELAVASSQEITVFKLHFEQAQEAINRMLECLDRMKKNNETENRGKLKKAALQVLSSAKEQLEQA